MNNSRLKYFIGYYVLIEIDFPCEYGIKDDSVQNTV